MKKIIFLVITFLIFNNNLYSLENEWTDEINIDKDIIVSQIRYRFYKPILLETKYELYDLNYKDEYDLNEYIYTEYSDWNEVYPESKFYREIETKTEYIDNTKFNSIHIYNFQGNNTFTIKGITVVKDSINKTIYYNLLGNEYVQSENLSNIINRISNPGVNFNSNSVLYLNFPEYYDSNDIKIVIQYNSNSNLNKSFDVSFNNDIYTVKYKTIDIEKHFSPIESLNIYSSNFETKNINILKYRYKDKLFKRDIFIKEYADGFFEALEEYNKDLETAKIFYKYKEKNICDSSPDIKEVKIEKEFVNTVIKEPNICICEKCPENNEIKNNICVYNKKSKTNYDIIIGGIFLIIGSVLYFSVILLKKLVNICRTK